MALNGNGKLAEPGQKAPNGLVPAPRSKGGQKQKGFSIFSVISRLLTWYSIVTIIFRCPSTFDLLTDSTPKICKPYFQLRSAIAPYAQPYYDAYAAPCMAVAQPYYETVDKRIITPATALGKKYAAPRVAQAQAFGQAQWEKTMQPQVLKYQGILKQKFDQSLAPHLDTFATSVGPYYEIARTNALQTYYGHILPSYSVIQPYALGGYRLVNTFAVNTGIPYARWAWNACGTFLERTVLPKVRILYGENVEPQLVRIGERLGRYRDGKNLRAVLDEIDNSSSAPPSPSSPITSSSTPHISSADAMGEPSSTSTTATSDSSPTAPEITPLTEAELMEQGKKIVQRDLKEWQEKFAKAADKGSDELEGRVTEITERLVENQAHRVGNALIIQLEETVTSSIKNLKSSIISLVKNSANKDEEELEESLNAAVRKAGVSIKEKAQAVRTWRQSFDIETNSLVGQAAESTFQILDGIRDLGLTEIGMRWAWTDGITYKDWEKYHQLKDKFDEWRRDVELDIIEHPGLEKARAASAEVESKAMDIAEEAAKELARVKETGRWKLLDGDASDDFSSKKRPAAAAASVASEKILEKASQLGEAVGGTSGTITNPIEATSGESGSGTSLADGPSDSNIETQRGNTESIVSGSEASASSLSEQVSSAEILKSSGAQDSSTLINSAASSASSTVSTKAWGGAMAQKVEARQIVYEDIIDDTADGDTYSDKIQSMASEVGDKFSDITKAVSEALLKPTSTEGGVSGVTSLAVERYSSALAAASSALYGTQQGMGESIASVGSSRYAEAVAAASAAIYGTPLSPQQALYSAASSAYYGAPQGALESMSSVASSKLSEGLSIASTHLESAKSYVAALNTPAPAKQKILGQVQDQFYAGIGLAHARYSEFTEAASSAVMPTQTPFHESIASAASENWEALITKASSQIYGAPTPYFITRSLLSEAKEYAAHVTDGVAAQASAVQSLVNELISGSEPDFAESVYSRLSSAYHTGRSEVAKKASEGIHEFASSVSSALDSAASAVKDEL